MVDAVKVGSEFLVNTETADDQYSPTVIGLANGGFVVTWEDFGAPLRSSIKAQIFGSDGTKVGVEFLVSSATQGGNYGPTITGLVNGGFVATWYSSLGSTNDNSGTGISAQIFSASGTKVGVEFLVNTQTEASQYYPKITSLSNGGFVVTWEDESGTLGDSDSSNIKAQVFGADGTKVGNEFLVNTETLNGQQNPTITGLMNGGFVVTWHDFSLTLGDSDPESIKAQIFGADGTKVGAEFLVNTETASRQILPTVTGLANGGFVVTWYDLSGTLGDSDGNSIKAQIFTASGAKVGTEFLVNTQTAGSQAVPVITALADGGFAVTWFSSGENAGDSSGTSIKAQVFSEDGTKQGSEFLVNTQTANDQNGATIAGLANGSFVVTWEDNSGTLGDVSGRSIKAQIFSLGDPAGAPVITSNGGGTTASKSVAENSTAVTTVRASDPDAGTTLTYAITGGADAGVFQIDSATGVLSFKAAPNFEALADVGRNNVYDVIVRASDGTLADTQAIAVRVTNVIETPVITSNGGGATAAVSVGENTTAVTTVRANDSLSYAIIGGADAAKFQIDAATGALSFKSAPDFEAPTDVGGNNVYDVIVRANDGTLSDTQAIAVTVMDDPTGAFKVGNEFRVNTQTAGFQGYQSITGLANGGFVVTWTDVSGTLGDSNSASIKAQVFGVNGNKVGGEFLVNTQTEGSQGVSSIAALAGGGFVISWADRSLTLGDSDGASVKAQVFAANGAKVGSEFLVNTETKGNQLFGNVTGIANGGFVITWYDRSGTLGDSEKNAVKAQVFSANGTKVGTEFLVNTQTEGFQGSPTVTGLANGDFVVAWYDESGTLGDSLYSIKAQVFSANGAKVGAEFLVNTQTAGYQEAPTITSLANGGFVATWQDESGTLGDSDGYSIKAQVFRANGTKVGTEFLVNTQTASDQYEPSVIGLPNGGFMVTWTDKSGTLGDSDGDSIKGQAFRADGSKVGGEILVNMQTSGGQVLPRIAALANGGVVISWYDYSGTLGDSDGTSVKAQIFSFEKAPDITGTAGKDSLKGTAASEKLFGLANDDRLTGLAGDDQLDGGTGKDVMVGGAGNDTYIVDTTGDKVAEKVGEGSDTVRTGLAKYSLGAHVENLTFTNNVAHYGIGNALANTLIGGEGTDRLDGGGGADVLKGNAGNDLYQVDSAGDRVIEATGGGIDTVLASTTVSLTAYVENVKLTGSGEVDASGNDENNVMTGNGGRNVLDGGEGNDRLSGFGGDDVLIGGVGNDVLSGGAGDDTLFGGLGRDQLTGGIGEDNFIFDTALNTRTNGDTIIDFVSGTDKIILLTTAFRLPSALAEGAFFAGAGVNTAQDADDRLIYNTATGRLWFDADGTGAESRAVLVAILSGSPDLAFTDILTDFLIAG